MYYCRVVYVGVGKKKVPVGSKVLHMEKQNKVISAKFQIIYYVDSSSFQGGITDSLLAEALYINVRCISIIDSAGG
jgi:hypothetical protein